MEIQIQLSDEERQLEQKCLSDIKEGGGHARKAYGLIVPALTIVYKQRLFREEGTFEEWAKKNLGFTAREAHYYLDMGEVKHDILAKNKDANVDSMALSHALALKKVEPDDRATVWQVVEDNYDKITAAGIISLAEQLEQTGEISFTQQKVDRDSLRRSRAMRVILKEVSYLDESTLSEMFDSLFKGFDKDYLQFLNALIQKMLNEPER